MENLFHELDISHYEFLQSFLKFLESRHFEKQVSIPKHILDRLQIQHNTHIIDMLCNIKVHCTFIKRSPFHFDITKPLERIICIHCHCRCIIIDRCNASFSVIFQFLSGSPG